MSRFFSARVFSLLFGLAYATAVFGNYPLFRYYPLISRISRQNLTDISLGPSMAWFGWIAMAAIPAAIGTLIIPKRMGNRIPAAAFWIVTALMLAAAWFRESEWFIG